MFKTITRLLFGGEEEAPRDVKSGEEVDDGWLVVPHQEDVSSENQGGLLGDMQRSNLTPHKDTSANIESDSLLEAEPTSASSRVVSDSVLQPKALTERTQLTCIQKAKAWAGRHHVSRSAIQRQNRVRQGVQHHSFHLQQPGHRSLSH